MYQIILCKTDGNIENPFFYDLYADAKAKGQEMWDAIVKGRDLRYSGAHVICDGKTLCSWTLGSETARELKFFDTRTGYRYDRETASGLLAHRYSRWQFRVDLSEEFGSIKLGRLGLEFSAGTVLWAFPEEFEYAYKSELLRMMEEIEKDGAEYCNITLAEEWWDQ